MKNIHVLPTDKPSRLFKLAGDLHLYTELGFDPKRSRNIYITNDEDIKEGDWFIANNGVHKCIRVDENTSCPFITLNSKGEEIGHFKTWKTKIILTTDFRLAPDVQKIDDEFLEWVVNNPGCEMVEVKPMLSNNGRAFFGYKIIIPREERNIVRLPTYYESKKETLEEVRKLREEINNLKTNKIMKKTAVEWLYEQVWINTMSKLPEIFKQAKEMEKQQIENAFTDGVTGDSGAVNPEQYYKETFNK
jgi:hypothetical protein